MAPFARRRAQICVPAAFIRKVKHFEQALLLLSGGAGYARCFRSVTGPAGASRRGREAYSCAPVWVANTLLSTTSSAARRLSSSARAASKQASTAWPCPGELLGESDRSVAGLRDCAKRRGRAQLRRLRRLRRLHRRHTGTSPIRHRRVCLDGAERARPPAARDVRSPTRDS